MPDETPEQKPGILIVVVGPSGAGKDTLIDAAKLHFNDRIIFPKRYITRADKVGEDHIPVTFDELQNMEETGHLFLNWEAHGLQYGISNGILTALKHNKPIILNISRRKIEEVKQKWPHTVAIHVSVNPDILLQRLQSRGRESAEVIKSRFNRQAGIAPRLTDYDIDNSGDLEISKSAFIEVIETVLKSQS